MLAAIRHGTAVLIDSNNYQRKMLRTLLRTSGFRRVSEFEDMESGVEEASRAFPDFLFVDFDTALQSELSRGNQNWRDNHLGADTYLVILLQNCTRQRVERSISFGAHWVVSRPFSPNSLNRRIRAVLDPLYRIPLDHAPNPVKKQSSISLEELSNQDRMTDLARQMDDLLKQSKYYKDGSKSGNRETKAQLLKQYLALESEFKACQSKEFEQEEEGVVLL